MFTYCFFPLFVWIACDVWTESLDEHRIRELNDEINKLLREKHHWEKRIRDLGGADYAVRVVCFFLRYCLRGYILCSPLVHLLFTVCACVCALVTQRTSAKAIDEDAIIGPGGYIYFGAAKKLPGVQELVRPQGSSS